MASQETLVAQKLREYIDAVRETTSLEEQRLQFSDMVRTVLGIPLGDSEVQSEMYGGQMYVLLGNLVFDFKRNLHWQPKDAELQLRRYIADLKSRRDQTDYIAIATDGLHFHVYRSRNDETGRIVELEKIHGLNLASPMMTPERAVRDLGMILAHFRREQV